MRIENEQNQQLAIASQVMTYEGEQNVIKISGKAAKEEDEQSNSVCSCTCLGGGNNCTDHDLLTQGYLPTDIVTSSLRLKRASF